MAESFGSDPERYDRARPRYPEAMVGAIVAASPGRDVLDVGCGTGIAAGQFQAAGCTVLGVDVDERMAEFARRHGIGVEVAAFESWEPDGRAFDAVIAGQTWHWVDPVAGAVKAAQVLRPRGRLAVFWNVFQPSAEIRQAFSVVYRRVVPDWPRNPWARPALDAHAAISRRRPKGSGRRGRSLSPSSGGSTRSGPAPGTNGATRWLPMVDASQFAPAKLEALLASTGAAIDAWAAVSRCGTPPWCSRRRASIPADRLPTFTPRWAASDHSTHLVRADRTLLREGGSFEQRGAGAHPAAPAARAEQAARRRRATPAC
jgi:SAM-dependent methyltransferase